MNYFNLQLDTDTKILSFCNEHNLQQKLRKGSSPSFTVNGVASTALPHLPWQLWEKHLSTTRLPTSCAVTRSGDSTKKELKPMGFCKDSEDGREEQPLS